jgi:uncharacterized repeat protein (TIGR01451 family)
VKTISGKVFNDSNNNGKQDNGEPALSDVIVSAKGSKAHAVTDVNGFYSIQTEPIVNDTLRISLRNAYVTVKPTFHLPQRTDSSYNFAVSFLPNVKDLSITTTSILPPRPGFDNTIVLTIENKGTTTLFNPIINMKYDSRIRFISTDTRPVVDTPQYFLSWTLGVIQPNTRQNISAVFNTPTNIPINSVLTHTIKVEPIAGDTTPKDNLDTMRLTVLGSYDPNDKQVNRPKEIDFKQFNASNGWQYTIRFQNTGNYPASFIRIVDTLNSNLDISSLQILASSHPMTYSILNKNVLVFFFDNINLDDSTTNETASHGFVKFAINPIKTLTFGSTVKNTAFIYFDYNKPIVTNTTKNDIVQLSAVQYLQEWQSMDISPNPTSGIVYFTLPNSLNEQYLNAEMQVEVIDITGRLVLKKTFTNERVNALDLMTLQEGIYFILVKSKTKNSVGKIVITK